MSSHPHSQADCETALLPCPFCGSRPETERTGFSGRALYIFCINDNGCPRPKAIGETAAKAAENWNTRVNQSGVQTEGDTIPLADHDKIGRKVLGQPWAIQAAIVTITAHCTVLTDKHPTGDVADLAGCISQQCLELANALAKGPSPAFDALATEVIDRIRQRYNKLAASPLGMSSEWERKASNGKPLLYGGKRGLLAYGTIATWDEFDLIVDLINNLPTILALSSPLSSAHQPCPGCDGHECDNGCAYPGALSSTNSPREGK